MTITRYYYDIDNKKYEKVYRTPTEEERKRAKESLEKEKEVLKEFNFNTKSIKKVLLNGDHKYLDCYREYFNDIGENDEPIVSSIINWYTKDGKLVAGYYMYRLINFLINHEVQCDYKQDGDGICSIGFSEPDQTWYGWSHRGICGIKIGTVIDSPCHLAYKAGDIDSLLEQFNTDDDEFSKYNKFEKADDNTIVQWKLCSKLVGLNDSEAIMEKEWVEVYRYKPGLGLTTIKTLDEAKQAAIIAAENLN